MLVGCKKCQGLGYFPKHNYCVCDVCNGYGYLEVEDKTTAVKVEVKVVEQCQQQPRVER